MAPKSYEGEDIAVQFDLDRCIHARACVLKLPQVFDPDARPWIKPDQASAEVIAAVIRDCPSGALTYEAEAAVSETPPVLNRVRVMENGPLAVTGDIAIQDEEPRIRAVLCRCGKSGHMPFCDNSHLKAGFEATGEPDPESTEQTDETGGKLAIHPAPNGPLRLKGNVQIVSGTGHRVAQLEGAALCRCGASGNKPFCDGSHREIGFETK